MSAYYLRGILSRLFPAQKNGEHLIEFNRQGLTIV